MDEGRTKHQEPRTKDRSCCRLESHRYSSRELDLLQHALTEAEGIAEVFIGVVEEGRLVTNVRACADRSPRKELHASADIQGELRFGLDGVRREKRGTYSAEDERPPSRISASQLINDVAVQLADLHREEVGFCVRRAEFERR